MKKRVTKGALVVVISGDDKGKKGKVLEVCLKKKRVKVEGVNVIVRHTKPRGQGQKGGRIQKEAYIDASNVMMLDVDSQQPVRVHGAKQKEIAHE
jgi:large subunit ribosomal protein L24